MQQHQYTVLSTTNDDNVLQSEEIDVYPSNSSSSSESHDNESSDSSGSSSDDPNEGVEVAIESSDDDFDPSPTASYCAILECDNLGFVPILIPVFGVGSMIGTVVWSCSSRFDCNSHYPTLSYAATFHPEGYVFMCGMCITALLILSTILLFGWHLKIRLSQAVLFNRILMYSVLLFGIISSSALFTLAVCDMKNYHDTHITSTIVFFVAAWMTIIASHTARVQILRQRASLHTLRVAEAGEAWPLSRCSPSNSFRYGKLFIQVGVTSSFVFALLFLSVNGIWGNPFGFTAAQEAFAELLAIICQLLFMGTLWYEVSLLTEDVEREYQLALMRSD